MFNKILIANRGEIAVRIIRACKELDIKTVAVYSEIDRNSIHVHLADEAICIGPANSSKSYLNIKSIITAAIKTKCDAIHPGYGFLSENSKFAKICSDYNIVFIGPKEEHIRKMGDKAHARRTMIKANVPVVPGSDGCVENEEIGLEIAKEIGFPVIIKAVSGGGGKGMRIVFDKDKFAKEFNMARQESLKAFDDDSMYIEKYIEKPRHIEFQIMADKSGNIVHLGERDCSLQRKNQKVLEEAPSYNINKSLRQKMGNVAVKAAKAVNYENVGTVEFLVDKNNNFYFIEMNTRIQVEHCVTELITGIDIVKEQIKISSGKEINYCQKDIDISGYSIECRINAEDPESFMPSPGEIKDIFIPGGYGIRFDSHIYSGYNIPPSYDSMIGKLIVWGEDREEAINRMKRSLDELIVTGINTNVDFHKKVLNNKNYLLGNIDTSFIEKNVINTR